MADYTALVDTDGTTGDYASLSAAEAAEQSTGGSGDTMTITVQASGGAADTTAVTFNGWTTDLLTITQADFPTDGIFDATAYRLQAADALVINADLTANIEGFQIHMNSSGFGDVGLAIDAFSGTWTIDIDKLIVFGDAGGSNSHKGVYLGRTDASGSTILIRNSTIYGFDLTAAIGVLIDPWDGEPLYTLINSTVYGCTTGVKIDDTGVVVKNCAVFNNGDDFAGDSLGTETVDYNASDDGDGTNAVTITQSADDWAALVTDAAGGDFSVTDASSELYNAGTNTGAPSADIIGTSRPQDTTVDIGAYELLDSGVTLVINPLTQSQALDNIGIVQQNILVITGMTQAQALDNLDLIQANILVITGMTQAQALDNIDLQAGIVLQIAGNSQAQTIENVSLVQQSTLSIDGIDQSQNIDNIVLSVGVILAIAKMVQSQNIDSVNFIQQNILDIAGIDQAQTLEQITLDTGILLQIAGIIQNQTLESLDLTQQHNLVIDKLLQNQIIDNVVFSLFEGKVIITLMLKAASMDFELEKPTINLELKKSTINLEIE